ncbi:MAG: ABC transporter substrate-binding protein [Clostridiaceae bacterium]|nr:ABC transporter substrate-binding protein [Clostridiaceae bacterium]
MKRLLSISFCCFVIFSMIFSGCAQPVQSSGTNTAENTTAAVGASTSAGSSDQLSKPGEYPIVKDTITLKFVTRQHPAITDYNTNEFSKYMEEKTNIKVEWETIPTDSSGSAKEKLNLLLASNQYPDAFFGLQSDIKDAGLTQYGSQEQVFLPLESYIDNSAVELKKIFKEIPGSREEITSLDGHIYSMPEVNQCYHCTYQTKMWVNQSWLDNLGMKAPTTTDEFYAMLKAFKEKDPNQNGIQDEIPMAGAQKSGWENEVEKFLLNSFCYYNLDMYDTTQLGLYMNNGKVAVPFNDPGIKTGLAYINKLYKEGLIYEGSFTQDNTQLTQLVENPDAELVGAIPSGYGGMFAQLGGDRYKQFVAISPLKGPDGVQNANTYPYEGVYVGGFVVTKACQYPEAAVKWADYLYTFDGTTRLTRGRPDQEWRLPKTGELGIDGKAALYVPLRAWDETEPQNESFIQVGITKRDNAYRLGEFMDAGVDMYSGDGLEKLLYTVSKDLYEPYAQKDKALPHIKFTKEETDELSTLKVELGKTISTTLTEFMIGTQSIDTNWDGFIQNLDKLKISRVLELYQTAYERQYK